MKKGQKKGKSQTDPASEEQIIDLKSNEIVEGSEQTLKSAGLGDTIKSITNALGITQCEGCKSRQKSLNKLFPWMTLSREMTMEEMIFIDRLSRSNQMTSNEADWLFRLYNELFPSRNPVKRCSCPGLIMKIIDRINSFIEKS